MRSLVLASLFVSASAIACPDLSGSYPVCKSNKPDSTPDQNMVISQEVTNGVTVYSSTSTDGETGETVSDSIAADGKENETTSPDGIPVTMKYTAKCEADALVIAIDLSVQGQNLGTISSTMTKEGNTLVTRTTGNVLGEDVSEETICE